MSARAYSDCKPEIIVRPLLLCEARKVQSRSRAGGCDQYARAPIVQPMAGSVSTWQPLHGARRGWRPAAWCCGRAVQSGCPSCTSAMACRLLSRVRISRQAQIPIRRQHRENLYCFAQVCRGHAAESFFGSQTARVRLSDSRASGMMVQPPSPSHVLACSHEYRPHNTPVPVSGPAVWLYPHNGTTTWLLTCVTLRAALRLGCHDGVGAITSAVGATCWQLLPPEHRRC